MLNRDQILGADDLYKEMVHTPEWGGSVFVRTMTGTERDRFEAAHLKSPDRDVRARLAVYTVCDDKGVALFAEADIPAISAKNAKALDRIFEVALRINGVGKQDVDDLKKNSPTTP